jgi:dihydrofolate synthase/folylpolyglutamate synthase
MTLFADYADARRYLEQFVPAPGTGSPPAVALARTQALVAALGNPQDAVPTIHLAGTSGKGSTASMLAAILQAQGLQVGLGLSPHVHDLRERIQHNGEWIDRQSFCALLGEMTPAIDQVAANAWGPPTFFEILIALAYRWFASLPVDVVVMETGLGGRDDATNVVRRSDKLALLTPIGFDHMELLGTTLAQIAHAKAGIIGPGNTVLAMRQLPAATAEIEAASAQQGATLHWFDPATLDAVRIDPTGVTFDLAADALRPTPWHDLRVASPGAHQAQNAALALTASSLWLARRGQTLDDAATRHALASITLPARMELRTWRGQTFLLDGAHNPAKMGALCTALAALYPQRRFTFVAAFKRDKEHAAILAEMLPYAARILITQFHNRAQGMVVDAADPLTLGAQLDMLGFSAWASYPTVGAALAAAATTPQVAPVAPIIVTGSIYLMAEVYAALGQT